MSGRNYFLMSFLPALGDLGADVSLSVSELVSHVRESGGPADLTEALALEDDLRQREAFLAGEIEKPDVAILTPEQASNEAPLPDHLVTEQDDSTEQAVNVDRIWQAYYRHAASVAKQSSSSFLKAWVSREVALRNAFAEARAKKLQLDVEPYLVASDLADEDADFTALLSEWQSAENPLAGLRVIEQNRWAWLIENEQWFSFTDDEVAVYAAKLLALKRWRNVSETKQQSATQANSQEQVATS